MSEWARRTLSLCSEGPVCGSCGIPIQAQQYTLYRVVVFKSGVEKRHGELKGLYSCKFSKEEQSVISVASFFAIYLVLNYIS